MPNRTTEQLDFGRLGRRHLQVNFEGGDLSSDGGLMLLRQIDARTGLSRQAARAMGLPYPGGVFLDKEAELGNPDAFSLPHPSVDGALFDFSFSGLKTAVINLIHNAAQKGDELPRADLAASFRRAVVDCLVRNVVAAMRETKERRLVIAGGVSANSLLRRELERICGENGWEFYRPELSLCGDNAAMVASQGYYEFLAGRRAGLTLNALATMDIQLNFEA